MRDEHGVLLRLAAGHAWMSAPVMGRTRAGKIEAVSLALKRRFLDNVPIARPTAV